MGEPSGQEPAPAATVAPPGPHPEFGLPFRQWVYHSALGDVVGIKCEFDGDGIIRTATLARNGVGLVWKACPLPMPLWGLEYGVSDAVCLCLDEESAESARYFLPEHTCLAPFSAHPEECDLSPLTNKAVLIWGTVGLESVAKAFAKAIKTHATIKVLRPPTGMPIGWNATEAIQKDHWGASDATTWLLKQRVGEPHVHRPQAVVPAVNGAIAPAAETETSQYQILGHAQGHIFAVPSEGGQVLDIPMHALTKAALPVLAPLQHWQMTYPGTQGVDWALAANSVIRQAYRRGVYDPGKIRGRGAWWDDGRCVLHLGDRLLVDGKPTAVREFKSRFTYEVGASIQFADARPLSDEDARKFPELCEMLSWTRPTDATWLVGFCVTAPFCGAWNYRSHLFLTGQAQAGKSWAAENIVNRMIGQIGLFLAATTSEPGIRRALRCDARPVIIDELEGSDTRSVERIKAIFHLFRYATSETGAEIVMGRQGGGIESFRPRFQGMTSAIGKLLTDYADVTRNSTATLKVIHNGAEREKRFSDLKAAHRALLTPAYIAGMQARILELIPVIRKNAETFAVAGAKILGARRLGDQFGLFAAGRLACYSQETYTEKRAADWIEKQDWEAEREIIQDTDGPSCYARIMERVISIRTDHGMVERSIAELVRKVHLNIDDAAVGWTEAADTLRRHGIIVKDSHVWIANKHSKIEEMLRGTPWPANWGDRLATIPGRLKSDNALRFGEGSQSRATGIPIKPAETG